MTSTSTYAVIEASGAAHSDGMKSYLCMMAIRLLELRRVLKPTGSIYLHCDDAAAHWLRVLTEAIFGAAAFRNEVIWKRIGNHNDAGRFGRTADRLLFYGAPIHREAVRVPLHAANVTSKYRYQDERGVYRTGDLTAKGLSGGGYYYDFHGHPGPWRYPEHRMLALEADDRIYLPAKAGGVPAFSDTWRPNKGMVPPDVWNDIPPVNSQAAERTATRRRNRSPCLERIISASSTPDDMVLDPFCGLCHGSGRRREADPQWVGIDISPLAVKLVRQRLAREVPLFTQDAIERTDVPIRTDEVREYLNEKRALYGQQEGVCAGCRVHFELRNMEVDHVIPRVKGGPNHISNYQLLCGSCNRRKGAGSQAELIAKLKRDGIIAA